MKPKGLKADLKYFIDRLKDSSAELHVSVFVWDTTALTTGEKKAKTTHLIIPLNWADCWMLPESSVSWYVGWRPHIYFHWGHISV